MILTLDSQKIQTYKNNSMQILFIHGWSVTSTDTYGNLPQTLSFAAAKYGLELDVHHIYLGKYISFHDEVTMDDIVRAMDNALHDLPGNNDAYIQPFSCITHSTGGPVVRSWVNKYYGAAGLKELPLKHLVMLAPANHGSALAKLGKARVGRMKAWFGGVEPGQGVLDWLSLGSTGQWELNKQFLSYNYSESLFFPFVLTGQGIDRKLYDFLNNYLVEKGSDGVVRVSGANMNYRYVSLVQDVEETIRKRPLTYKLSLKHEVKCSEPTALGIYSKYSHSGTRMGIMASEKSANPVDVITSDILKCFQVNTFTDYEKRTKELEMLSVENQKDGGQFCMLVLNIHDDYGQQIMMDDYEVLLLGGKRYKPDDLPKGFLMDRQMNDKTGRLVFYMDAHKMAQIKDGKFGMRVVARPAKGFSFYAAAEFQSGNTPITEIFIPNQTTYVDVELRRFVDKNVFRFGDVSKKPVSFKDIKPSGDFITGE